MRAIGYGLGMAIVLGAMVWSTRSLRDGIGLLIPGLVLLAWLRFVAPGMKQRHDLTMDIVSKAIVGRRALTGAERRKLRTLLNPLRLRKR